MAMTRILVPAFLLTLVAAPAMAQYYSEQPPDATRPVLRTQGKGTVYADPDSVRVIFGIETQDANIDAARRENEAKSQRLIKALAALPIPDVKVKTLSAAVRTIPEWQSDLKEIKGYRMRSQVTFLVNGTRQKLGEYATRMADTGLQSGASALIDVIFFLSDSSKAERAAIGLAVANARANADALAQALGVKIKSYGTVSSSPQRDYYFRWSSYWWWDSGDHGGMRQVMLASDAAGTGQMIPGQLEITVNANLAAVYE